MNVARYGIAVSILLFAIAVYRRILSPLFPSACRFHPTCSQYAADAIRSRGATRGTWLAIRRLARCHPLHPGGVDPAPRTERSN